MRVIETVRVRLEPQTASHADEMFIVLSDPAIYQYENAAPSSLDWLRERYQRLETRCSADGREQWLNWVVRMREGAAIGFVQATIYSDHRAGVAYEFSSKYWGRGYAGEAVGAMIAELESQYRVVSVGAILKAENWRSARLLRRLGFVLQTPTLQDKYETGVDEIRMVRNLQ